MPRWRSSGALSIWSKATSRLAGSPGTAFARVLVMAAVSVVLPWSTWPMVPTFRCGLFLSNFPLDIWVLLSCSSSAGRGLALLGDLLGDALRHLFVVIELHGEGGAPLGLGAHGGRVTEHLGERHHRPDDLAAAAGVHALDLAPARTQVAHDVAHELLWHDDFDVHHRLEQDRVGPLEGLLRGHGARDLERHLGGVDVVVGPVDELDLDVDDRKTRHDTAVHRALDALVHARDVLPGDHTADDLVFKLVALLLVVFHVDDGVAVLAAATGLAHEAALDALDALAHGLPVGDLRAANVGVHPELAQEPVHDDLEVKLAHAGDNGLTRLLVAAHGERRVLLGETLERDGQLLLVGLRLRLDSLVDYRLGGRSG